MALSIGAGCEQFDHLFGDDLAGDANGDEVFAILAASGLPVDYAAGKCSGSGAGVWCAGLYGERF